MKFASWSQFEARFPELAKVLIAKSGEVEYLARMRENIEQGRDFSTKQRRAVEKFLPPIVGLSVGKEFDAVITLTGFHGDDSDDGEITWSLPELRWNGRLTEKTRHEFLTTGTRNILRDSKVIARVHVRGWVKWVRDGFSIIEVQHRTDVVSEAVSKEKIQAILDGKKPTTYEKVVAAEKRSEQLVRLEFSDSRSNKFWEAHIAPVFVKVGEGTRNYVVTRKWGRIGSVGQTKTDTLDTEASARSFVAGLAEAKRDKGYQDVTEDVRPSRVWGDEGMEVIMRPVSPLKLGDRVRVNKPGHERHGLPGEIVEGVTGGGWCVLFDGFPESAPDRFQEWGDAWLELLTSENAEAAEAARESYRPRTEREKLLPSFSSWEDAF